ncbi:MAG: hypothetical protein ACXU8A_13390, partial [Burkholderiaceae bacterium]
MKTGPNLYHPYQNPASAQPPSANTDQNPLLPIQSGQRANTTAPVLRNRHRRLPASLATSSASSAAPAGTQKKRKHAALTGDHASLESHGFNKTQIHTIHAQGGQTAIDALAEHCALLKSHFSIADIVKMAGNDGGAQVLQWL